MNSPRLLLVSQSFWPLAGESSLLATALAEELLSLGCNVSVLTSQVVRQWPEQFDLDGICVNRIAYGGRISWPGKKQHKRNEGWTRSTAKWISSHSKYYDAFVALDGSSATPHGLRQLAKASLPFVVRFDRSSIDSWSELSGSVNEWIDNLIFSEGTLPDCLDNEELQDKVTQIDDGVPHRFAGMSKDDARKSLAMTHEIFDLPPGALLAINTQSIENAEEFENLIVQWRTVAASVPGAKLWLLGSGLAERTLFQRIRDYNIDDSIIMPGQFESIDVVMQAADLMILETSDSEFTTETKMAIELNLPVICRAGTLAANYFEHRETGLISSVQPGSDSDSPNLAKLVIECCRNSQLAAKLGQTAKARFADRFAMSEMANRYLTSLKRIMAAK